MIRAPPTCYSIRLSAQLRARLAFLRTLSAVSKGCNDGPSEGALTFALQHLPSGRWTWRPLTVGSSKLATCLIAAMEAQVFRMLPVAPEAVEAMTFTVSLAAGYPGHGYSLPEPEGGLECLRDLDCPGDRVCACADTACSLMETPGQGHCLAPDAVSPCS